MDLPSIMYTYFGIEWTARAKPREFTTAFEVITFLKYPENIKKMNKQLKLTQIFSFQKWVLEHILQCIVLCVFRCTG